MPGVPPGQTPAALTPAQPQPARVALGDLLAGQPPSRFLASLMGASLPFRLFSPPPPPPLRTPATEKIRLPRTIAPLQLPPAWHCPQAWQSWQL